MVESGEINSFNARTNELVRSILNVYYRARQRLDDDILKEVKIPTIAVIGMQSHGKSSVLENIARISLPKGNGTVTRCPLELMLRNRQEEGPIGHDYATIAYKGMPWPQERHIDDLDQIQE